MLRERRLHDVRDEVFHELHVAVEVHEGHLRLDHPELGQVAARLRLLGAEGGAEAVDLAERHRARLHVELAGLGEVGLAEVEVGDLEEGGGPLAGARREDRRVDEGEAAPVEEVADGLHDRVPDAQDDRLPLGAQPVVALLHEEGDPVLLVADGELAGRLRDHPEVLHVELEADGRPRVLLHEARHRERGLLGQVVGLLEDLRADVALEDDALDDAGAVPQLQEVELAGGAAGVEPAVQRDLFALVLGDVGDVDGREHGATALLGEWARAL